MAYARLFARSGRHAQADIASIAVGTAPVIERMFAGVAPLQSAGLVEVSFLDDRRYSGALEQRWPGRSLCIGRCRHGSPNLTIAIVTAAAYEEWAPVATVFHPVPPPTPGVHALALVDPDARGDASPEIGPTR